MRKAKKIIRIIFLIIFLLAILGFFAYLFVPYGISKKNCGYNIENTSYNEYAVTGVKNETVKNLVIDEIYPKTIFEQPKVITSVKESAFHNNKILEKVYLPKTIASIESDAFSGCSNLTKVVLSSETPPMITHDSFENTTTNFYVPVDSYDVYCNSYIWDNFSDRIYPDYNNEEGYGCILFDSSGGDEVENIASHRLNTPATSLPVPTKEGYAFEGWYTKNNKKIDRNTMISKDLKLEARWSLVNFDIVYELNDGQWETKPQLVYTIEDSFWIPTPIKTGYTFAGWYTTKNFKGTAVEYIPINTTGTLYLYAKWEARRYDLIYELNGGVWQNITPADSFTPHDEFKLSIPTRSGHVFGGWYSNPYFIGDIVTGILLGTTEDVTVYAKWDLITYYITYDLNEGEWKNDTPISSFTVEDNVILPTPTRSGYTFLGWCTTSDYSDTPVTALPKNTSGNQKLYAQWTPHTYVFEFNTFSEESVQKLSIGYNQTLSLPILYMRRDEQQAGYLFKGWSRSYLNNNGSEGNMVEWSIVPYLGESGKVIQLYAVWEKIPTSWFSIINKNDKLYIGGLTSEWENYSGPLNKHYLYLPNSYGGNPIYGIADGAFEDKKTLKEIGIPTSIEYIEENAFRGCLSLTNIKGAEQIKYVGENAFADTDYLKNHLDKDSSFLTLGTVILKYDRLGKTNITESSFPANAKVIGYNAFENVKGSNNGSITIPNRIEYIYDNAFLNSGFRTIVLPSNAKYGKHILKGVTVNSLTISSAQFDFAWLFDSLDTITINTLIVKNVSGALSFEGNNITISSFTASELGLTAVTLNHFKEITTLSLDKNKIANLTINEIPIQTLDLSNNNLSSLNLSKIYAAKLYLDSNVLTSVVCGIRNEYVKIIYMPSLQNQSKNAITNLSFVQNLPNLMSLDVANNSIMSITGLETLTNLTELYLGGNAVLNNYSQMSLINTVEFCQKLKRLNLGGYANNKTVLLSIVQKSVNLEWLQIYGIGASSSDITGAINETTHSKLKYIKITHNDIYSVPAGLTYITKAGGSVVYDNNAEQPR